MAQELQVVPDFPVVLEQQDLPVEKDLQVVTEGRVQMAFPAGQDLQVLRVDPDLMGVQEGRELPVLRAEKVSREGQVLQDLVVTSDPLE